MGVLHDFERRLEQTISSAFAKAFRSAVQPVEIAAGLQRECDNNAQILSRDRRMVPNRFHVELAPTDLDRLSAYDSAMASELSEQLQEHADNQGYVFPGPISIDFAPSEDLTTGRFRIRSEAQAQVRSNATQTQVTRAKAVVEVNGSKHPLHPPAMVVGRGTEADIRINDPSISRKHIQFEVAGSGAELNVRVRDLGSTNGMLVDGHRIANTGVHDGSQVTIGNTTLTVQITAETVQEDADV